VCVCRKAEEYSYRRQMVGVILIFKYFVSTGNSSQVVQNYFTQTQRKVIKENLFLLKYSLYSEKFNS